MNLTKAQMRKQINLCVLPHRAFCGYKVEWTLNLDEAKGLFINVD